MSEHWKWGAAASVCLAWTVVWTAGPDLPAAAVLAVSAAALVCACLLLAWASQAIGAETSPAVTAGAVATAACLPQVVAALVWAWSPGDAVRPGLPLGPGHRALVGFGWPAALAVYWAMTRRTRILFREGTWVELLSLFFAASWAFVIVVKQAFSFVDTAFLGGVLSLYFILSFRIEPAPAARPGPLGFLREADAPWRQVGMAGALALSAAFAFQSWWAFSEAAGAVFGSAAGGWVGALIHQAPLLITGLALILQDAPAQGLRLLVAGHLVLLGLPAALAPIVRLIAAREFHRTLAPDQTGSLLLTASIGFLGFLLLSGLELTAGGAALLALAWVAGVVFDGPSGAYGVSAAVMATSVAIVAWKRRGFEGRNEE